MKVNVNKKEIGQRIRLRREYLRMTQGDLGKEFGVEQGTISQYERGTREIGSTDLPRLAQILRVSINYFFGEGSPEDDTYRVFEIRDEGSGYVSEIGADGTVYRKAGDIDERLKGIEEQLQELWQRLRTVDRGA